MQRQHMLLIDDSTLAQVCLALVFHADANIDSDTLDITDAVAVERSEFERSSRALSTIAAHSLRCAQIVTQAHETYQASL